MVSMEAKEWLSTAQVFNDDKQAHWYHYNRSTTRPGDLTLALFMWKGPYVALWLFITLPLVHGLQWLSSVHTMRTILSILHMSSPDPYCISSELQTYISNCLLISIQLTELWVHGHKFWFATEPPKNLCSRNGVSPVWHLSPWESTYFNSKVASDLHIGLLTAGLPQVNS